MSGGSAPISQTTLTNTRVDFDRDAFDQLVTQKGLQLEHQEAVRCSCIREMNGNALPECINCSGSGYIYLEPHTIRGVIQSIGFNPKYMQYSQVNLGTAMLTTKYTERIGWYDKITIKDGETVFHENVFPFVRGVAPNDEASALLTYEPIKAEKVFMFVDPVSPHIELIEGVGFTIDGRKLILSNAIKQEMIDNNEDKRYITVRYQHRPSYLVMDIQHDVRNTRVIKGQGVETLQNMPIQCMLKKLHYILGDGGFG